MRREKRTERQESIERMNGKIKLWIQMKYVLCCHCIVCVWMSEWLCVSLLFTYLFIVSRVHIVGSISSHFECDVSVDSVHFCVSVWSFCVPECESPLTFICFCLFVCAAIPTNTQICSLSLSCVLASHASPLHHSIILMCVCVYLYVPIAYAKL